MEDIEPISLGLEIWPREFETVTHLLIIRVVPCSLPTPWLCSDLHPSIASCTASPLRPLYDLSILDFSSFTHPLSVFDRVECEEFEPRVWYRMARVGLWYLGGLRYEDWSTAWWDCHLSCREYRDWSLYDESWLVMGNLAWWDHRLLCFEMIIFEIIIEHLEYGWCMILEGWRGYIRWTSIFSIDHLRAW